MQPAPVGNERTSLEGATHALTNKPLIDKTYSDMFNLKLKSLKQNSTSQKIGAKNQVPITKACDGLLPLPGNGWFTNIRQSGVDGFPF